MRGRAVGHDDTVPTGETRPVRATRRHVARWLKWPPREEIIVGPSRGGRVDLEAGAVDGRVVGDAADPATGHRPVRPDPDVPVGQQLVDRGGAAAATVAGRDESRPPGTARD